MWLGMGTESNCYDLPLEGQRTGINFMGPTGWVAMRTICTSWYKAVDDHGINDLNATQALIGALLEIGYGFSPFYFDDIEESESGVFDIQVEDIASGRVDRDALYLAQRYFKFYNNGYVVPVAPLSGTLLKSMTFTSYGVQRNPEEWPSWISLHTGSDVDEFLKSEYCDNANRYSCIVGLQTKAIAENPRIQELQSLLRLNLHKLLNRYTFCTAKIFWEPIIIDKNRFRNSENQS